MTQTIAMMALVVRDYDEALAFYVGTLGFSLLEDTYMPAQNKRWVVVAPPGSAGPRLLLARPSAPSSRSASATRPAGVSSCSCTPTTSGATTRPIETRA